MFEVQARYAPIKPIGKGAYGVVCSARNVDTDEKVAIKKIANAFENAVDAKRTLREMKLLRHLKHENVIRIVDVVRPKKSVPDYNDVYVMYELMDTDLPSDHPVKPTPQRRPLPVLHIPTTPRPEVRPQRQRAAPGLEAEQPAVKRQLRFENLRLWTRANRPRHDGVHDRVRGHAVVPRPRAVTQLQ